MDSLVGSTVGSAARPPRQSTDRKVRASRRRRGVGSTAGSAGVRATEHRRERLDAAKVRREVARLVPEGRAALGHARVVLLEGPGDEAPRPLRLDELERGPVRLRAGGSRRWRRGEIKRTKKNQTRETHALLVGVAALPRLALGILARLLVRAEAPPPSAAARLARELVRQVDLFGQVALLALFVGVAVGDRPRRRDAPRSPAFCSGSRRWRLRGISLVGDPKSAPRPRTPRWPERLGTRAEPRGAATARRGPRTGSSRRLGYARRRTSARASEREREKEIKKTGKKGTRETRQVSTS